MQPYNPCTLLDMRLLHGIDDAHHCCLSASRRLGAGVERGWLVVFCLLVHGMVRHRPACCLAMPGRHGLRSDLTLCVPCRYPQLLLNWSRKSVVGLSFDTCIINSVSFACYTVRPSVLPPSRSPFSCSLCVGLQEPVCLPHWQVFNCVMFWSPSERAAYERAHGGVSIDVRSNDVVFSVHALAATVLTLWQVYAYERGSQRVSAWLWASLAGSCLAVLSYAGLQVASVPGFTTLGLLYLLSYLKLAGSLVKYVPQLALNRSNRSTEGFTIANALTDIAGGVLSIAQQVRAYELANVHVFATKYIHCSHPSCSPGSRSWTRLLFRMCPL